MADSHDAKDGSLRRSYTHDLGRKLADGNSGAMQWGDEYRQFHWRAWDNIIDAIPYGGHLILNVKDHPRGKKRQYVAGWHVTVLCLLGLHLLFHREVETPSLRVGENRQVRFPEQIYVFQKFAERFL